MMVKPSSFTAHSRIEKNLWGWINGKRNSRVFNKYGKQ